MYAQATAAVTVAALLGAERLPGVAPLEQQTFLFFGAGQASGGSFWSAASMPLLVSYVSCLNLLLTSTSSFPVLTRHYLGCAHHMRLPPCIAPAGQPGLRTPGVLCTARARADGQPGRCARVAGGPQGAGHQGQVAGGGHELEVRREDVHEVESCA